MNRYRSFSRFTAPQGFAFMLADLPSDVVGICEIAQQQTIHHNLLTYYGIPNSQRRAMIKVWPPKVPDILRALRETAPHTLYLPRPPWQRIVGACILESHFLASLLRSREIPVRIRAGYFKDIRTNEAFIVSFWEKVLRDKGVQEDLLKTDPIKWQAEINNYTQHKNSINHHIEHWVCEYWDETEKQWRLLDANPTFLKAHSDLEVGYHLPRAHFEHAHEAWQTMRSQNDFNPERYAEAPQDGRSHIRSQLLWDYFSLLQHDLTGWDEPSASGWTFIKAKTYADLSTPELDELDKLAKLLAEAPSVEELVAFYQRATTLKLESVEQDPYAFVVGA